VRERSTLSAIGLPKITPNGSIKIMYRMDAKNEHFTTLLII